MAVLIPGKLLYLATPHTASIATTHALETLPTSLTTGISGLHDRDNLLKVSHHGTASDCAPYLLGNELVVTTVRNPLDLLVTYWLRQQPAIEKYLGASTTFEEFVKHVDDVVGPQFIRRRKMFWHEGVDQVLHYESLAEDLNSLLRELDLPEVVLAFKNVTQDKKPWQEYYNEAALASAKERFEEEIRLYGY